MKENTAHQKKAVDQISDSSLGTGALNATNTAYELTDTSTGTQGHDMPLIWEGHHNRLHLTEQTVQLKCGTYAYS